MATTLAPTFTPDTVISFQITPGTLPSFWKHGPTLEASGDRLTLGRNPDCGVAVNPVDRLVPRLIPSRSTTGPPGGGPG